MGDGGANVDDVDDDGDVSDKGNGDNGDDDDDGVSDWGDGGSGGISWPASQPQRRRWTHDRGASRGDFGWR